MPPLWPPASHHLYSSCPHRLPRPLRLHVHEPVGSPVHGEAYGQPPGLHGQPSERPADSECIGDAPQCPGLHVPSHHSCCGPALRSAGGPHRNQLGRPAQLSGGCPVLSQDSPAVGTFSQAAPGAEPAHSRCLLGACCRVWAVSAVFPPTEPSCRVSSEGTTPRGPRDCGQKGATSVAARFSPGRNLMSEGWFPSMGHTPFVLKSVKSV